MKLNSLVTFHINKIKDMDLEYAQDYLYNAGFSRIGSGCESVVYSRKGFDYVIKLQFCSFEFSGQHSIPNEHFFVPTTFIRCRNFNIIIQKKVEQTACSYIYSPKNIKQRYNVTQRYNKFVNRMEKLYGVSDLHDCNVGMIKGKFVIFDWNTPD